MVITPKDFIDFVEETFATTDLNMIDSVLLACSTFNVDPEMVEPFINRSIKEKIRVDYVKLNYLKETNNIIA
jgi:hypothetical protein